MTGVASRLEVPSPEKRVRLARIVRRAEPTCGIDVFPRPAASPAEVGSVRVPHIRFTGVPTS